MPPSPSCTPLPAEDVDARSVALMQRVRNGDEEAFRELVEMHQSLVIGTCARMLGSVDDAHDLAQQVFLRVWKAAPRYEASARFTTWLFTILRNLVFNESRRRSRKPSVSLDEPVSEDASPREWEDATARPASEALMHRELEQAVDAAIHALPENQRLAVVLRRYEDLSYEEIAAVLKTSVSSVKSLLFRARGTLRESLKGFIDGGSEG